MPGDIPTLLVQVDNRALEGSIQMLRQPSPRYMGSGDKTLIDGRIGSRAHDDGFWMGWEADNMLVVIDLKKEINVSSVDARFLNSPGTWIFAPEKVSYSYSSDGRIFTPAESVVTGGDLHQADIRTVSLPVNKNIRYLRIEASNIGVNPEWHTNPGEKSWLFCDEIIIK